MNDSEYFKIDKYLYKIITMPQEDLPKWREQGTNQEDKKTWNYIDGCMLTSLYEMYEITGNREYYDFVKRFVDNRLMDDNAYKMLSKSIKSCDLGPISEGCILLSLNEGGNEKIVQRVQAMYEHLSEHPMYSGNIFYHNKQKNIVYLEDLYFALVFYARYEFKYNKGTKYADIVNQFKFAQDHMRREETDLYSPVWDTTKKAKWADKKTGLSESCWARSYGWFLAALADVIEIAQKDPRKKIKKNTDELKKIFDDAVKKIEPYVDSDIHMIYQVVNQIREDGNYLETSGSALLAYALMKGARLEIIDKMYATKGNTIFNGICDMYLAFDTELKLGGISPDVMLLNTGKQGFGTYSYYTNLKPIENEAVGIALFIMAYTEHKRIKLKEYEGVQFTEYINAGVGWENILSTIFNDDANKEKKAKLFNHIDEIKNGAMGKICPNKDNIFKVLEAPYPKKFRCMILGNDPYPYEGYATGIPFEISEEKLKEVVSRDGKRRGSALIAILTEWGKDTGEFDVSELSKIEKVDLGCWRKKGVFLMNRVFTVRQIDENKVQEDDDEKKDEENPFEDIWKWFTEKVVEEISKKEKNCVFIFFGRHWEDFCKKFSQEKEKDKVILEYKHPGMSHTMDNGHLISFDETSVFSKVTYASNPKLDKKRKKKIKKLFPNPIIKKQE